MKISLVILFLLYGSGVFAESVAPEKIEKHASVEQNTRKEQEKSESNYPIKKDIKAAVPPKEIVMSERPQNKQDEGSGSKQNEELILHYTKLTARSTFLLFIVTGFLCWVTWLLKRVAAYEFNATHRPKIIIHAFDRIYSEDHNVGAVFTYVNIGATTAKIIEIEANIFLSDNVAAEDTATIEQLNNLPLKTGEKTTFRIKSNISDITAIIDGMKEDRGQPSHKIMCVGRVKYSDRKGTLRETGFCRIYDAAAGWLRVENSDHEYAY